MLNREPDYIELWRQLVLQGQNRFPGEGSSFNRKDKAAAFEAGSRRKNQDRPDPLIDFVVNELKPGETALDIGAGTGRWTLPLARVASKVTAIEPAGAMAEILKANADEAGVAGKIEFVSDTWEEADVAAHDIVVCAHAMYGNPDFATFINRMESLAMKRCYLGVRHFPSGGIVQELHTRIFGQPHDSPNFIVAYNALYQMGIHGNVLMEDLRKRWKDNDMESAFKRAKRHLNLPDSDEKYDGLIQETLDRRLELIDGAYVWPDGMNSVLIWWDVSPTGN